MALNIKNLEVDRLAGEVAAMAGENKTEAIRKALEERKERLSFQIGCGDRVAELRRFLESEVWPAIPKTILGKKLSRKEKERILGYGKAGV